MANTAFFIAWPLWAEMTFVLACGIVVVFLAGLIKLWWQTRYVRKHTLLDEERRARQQEIRKSGIPTSKRIDIPFGVRAIQNGLEVDGIWISTPNTPAGTESGAPSIMTSDSDYKGKEKIEPYSTGAYAANSQQQSPQASPSSSYFDAKDTSSVTAAHLNAVRETYQPRLGDIRHQHVATSRRTPSPRGPELSHGQATRPVHLETYVPTSPPSEDLQARQYRNSGSSSDEGALQRYLPAFQPHGMDTHQRRGASDDIETSWLSNEESFGGFGHGQFPADSFETHGLEPNTILRPHPGHCGQRSNEPALRAQSPAQPQRQILQANDSHANTATRQINPGFEVLPAGTFVAPENQIDSDTDQSPRRSRADSRVSLVSRLHRKGHGRSCSGEA